jgi:predicted nucleic acid-binding protein
MADNLSAVTNHLLELVEHFNVKGKQIHDANIVATMLAYGIKRLLTFNTADFERYRSVIEILPLIGQT